jgi:actin cytoskeleton-regulatory complex protein SLA1
VQKWQVIDIEGTSIDKSKHIHIEVGGSAPTNLHFNAGSKDTAEAIVTKLQSSKALSTAPRPSVSSQPEVPPATASPPPAIRNPNDVHKNLKNGASVRFAPTSLVIPRSPSVEEYPEHESEPEPDMQDKSVANYGTPDGIGDEDTADALYDFDADGEDELSVKEGERLVIVERDSDEWWKCRNVHGVEGVVPASYLEVRSSPLNFQIALGFKLFHFR